MNSFSSVRLQPIQPKDSKKGNYSKNLRTNIEDGNKITSSSKVANIKSIKNESDKHQISSLGRKLKKTQSDNQQHYPVGTNGMSMYELNEATKKLQDEYFKNLNLDQKGGRKRKTSKRKKNKKSHKSKRKNKKSKRRRKSSRRRH